MDAELNLESLVDIEQTFYDTAYEEGYAHGRIHAAIEGRAMGREKGFEIWEELGFYEGFARVWKTVYDHRQNPEDERVKHHIKHLLNLISKFPLMNPSAETDLSILSRPIRSRYKMLCSSLGVMPSLRASQDQILIPAARSNGSSKKSKPLWRLEDDARRPAEENQGLNF